MSDALGGSDEYGLLEASEQYDEFEGAPDDDPFLRRMAAASPRQQRKDNGAETYDLPAEVSIVYKQLDVSTNIVHNSRVKLWSSETSALNAIIAHTRRIVHLLDTKRVPFELLYVDRHRELREQMEVTCDGGSQLPYLQIGDVALTYEKVQHLEDAGLLDAEFAKAGVVTKKKTSINGHQRGVHQIATSADTSCFERSDCGAVLVQASASFVNVSWEPSRISQSLMPPADSRFLWLLAMDGEPIFIGGDTEYLVTEPVSQEHQFTLHTMEEVTVTANNGITAPRVSRPVATVTVGVPRLRAGRLSVDIQCERVVFEWDEAADDLAQSEASQVEGRAWALLMDGHRLYRGLDTRFAMEKTLPRGDHKFQLSLIDEDGDDISSMLGVELGVIKMRTSAVAARRRGDDEQRRRLAQSENADGKDESREGGHNSGGRTFAPRAWRKSRPKNSGKDDTPQTEKTASMPELKLRTYRSKESLWLAQAIQASSDDKRKRLQQLRTKGSKDEVDADLPGSGTLLDDGMPRRKSANRALRERMSNLGRQKARAGRVGEGGDKKYEDERAGWTGAHDQRAAEEKARRLSFENNPQLEAFLEEDDEAT